MHGLRLLQRGQKVSQVTFGGQSWRQAPQTAKQMFEVFLIMRDLHELCWYLTEALTLQAAGPLHDELRLALQKTNRITQGSPYALLALDVAAHRRDVNALLLQTTENARAEIRHTKTDYRGADLIGAKLEGANLGGANLTGSIFLIQSQLDSAKGNDETRLSPSYVRPAHWSSSGT